MNLWRLTALVAILTCLLAGCGQRQKPGVTVIRLTSWGNDVEEQRLIGIIKIFEKRHPDIKVELELTPWPRVFDKLMISSAGGRTSDVARVSSEWYAPLAAKGLLEPLESYVRRDRYDLDDFYPEAIEGWGKYNGVLYDIPTDIDIHTMYYNKTMFDKAGLPYPDWSWDWKKLVEVSRKLTKDTNGDGRLDQWGCSQDPIWQCYVYATGGSIISADGKKCLLGKRAAYEGLQFMADLVNKYHVAPCPDDEANLGTPKLFTSGKLGMLISGSWAAELLFKNEIKGFEYDAAPMPKGPGARATFIGGAAWAMLAKSKHKEQAWELVKWMTGKEYQRNAALGMQIVPSRRSVAESGAYLKLDRPPRNRKVFLDMIPYGRANPPVPCCQEMNEIARNELDRVKLGKERAESACKRLVPVIDELLRHSE